MSKASNHKGSVRIMSTLALIALLAATALSSWSCSQKTTETTKTTTAPPPADDNDVHVKVDLPDTVTIKP